MVRWQFKHVSLQSLKLPTRRDQRNWRDEEQKPRAWFKVGQIDNALRNVIHCGVTEASMRTIGSSTAIFTVHTALRRLIRNLCVIQATEARSLCCLKLIWAFYWISVSVTFHIRPGLHVPTEPYCELSSSSLTDLTQSYA